MTETTTRRVQYTGYRIVNRANGRAYIGMTRMGLRRRWVKHVSCARCGMRGRLYDAMREHGAERFTISPLVTVLDPRIRWDVERELIAQWGTCSNGYNELPGVPRCLGDPGVPAFFALGGAGLSADAREKIGAARRGRRDPPEVLAKKSAAQMGNRKAAGYRNTPESLTRRSIACGGPGAVCYAGTEYPTSTAAAKAAGVTSATFLRWVRRFGRNIPEATADARRAWRWANSRECLFRGIRYRSYSEAARSLGISLDAIRRSVRTGRPPLALRAA